MGASTALQHAAIDKRATFYIADCPFSDLTDELIYRLRKDWCIPPFPLLHITRLFAWLRTGFHFHLVSPIRNMAEIETPILFIHGKEDKNIPMEMTLELYRAKKGPKQLFLVPGADHAQSLRTNPHNYDCIVGDFLAELGLVTTEIKTSNSKEAKSDEFTDQNDLLNTSGFEEGVL
jgi:fermentation-respiration switch protein FrsA (DUF1100 family)